ncbi:MAG TPA: PSD1 and planctomycete cytochrome C domain-containing protein [Planctomycetaceae bacterium]|nr:PSD1 and planctomycete cytochrome C domain-containing protein [Planctomycetaceae bacterium]
MFAQDDRSIGKPIDFVREVLPIFQEKCHKCHGGVRRQGGLSLLTREDALAALPSGLRAIAPGQPGESELLRRVTATEVSERMPPGEGRLDLLDIAVLRRWIAEGAPWEPHWSFRPVHRPVPPPVEQSAWVRNPIDQFVLGRLESAALSPSPEAPPTMLVRRVFLDLLGVLPEVEAVEAYCSDSRPDRYERLVDELLANPQFGERWGRHWLDQARYADTDGFEVDGPRPEAWVWRDWVIAAWNDDLPFDQFTLEQLAGDLLPEATPQQTLATAFHRQSLTNQEGGIDKGEARYKELVDRVNATSTIWLGLTIGCAQCHNHPYDPFTQRTYFELYAFFNGTDDSRLQLTTNHTMKGPPSKENSKEFAVRVVAQSREPRTTTVYHRGDFLQPCEAVEPRVLPGFHQTSPGANRSETPDRLDLARWIMHADNPLTSRVAANQLWLRLFGEGLVRTPEDFGARGESPTHPDLLDWLADEYRACSWSSKRIIRQLVTSATYRQSSQHRSELLAVDLLNALWHRQNRIRVEAEIVRDLSLCAAGMLTREIGGPGIYPPLPEEVAKLSFRSNYVWPASQGRARYRRGLYVFYKRTLPHPNLDTFDCPDATAARMQRAISNTPLQALLLLNNEVHVEAAQGLARRVIFKAPPLDDERIRSAFQICLSRSPTKAESQTIGRLLKTHRDWYDQHGEDAGALIGDDQTEGVAVREMAAWTATLAVLLNLDEFLTRE